MNWKLGVLALTPQYRIVIYICKMGVPVRKNNRTGHIQAHAGRKLDRRVSGESKYIKYINGGGKMV